MYSLFSYVNNNKLDPTYVKINTRLPVYITLTTIPSRLPNTIKIIKHFLSRVTGFEKIILNVPNQYNRWKLYSPPQNIDQEINDPRFVLNRCDDHGPLTKLLPSLPLIPKESITIIADDMCYTLKAFKDIAEKQDRVLNKSFSFYVYPYKNETGSKNVYVPQGADLISIYTKNLDHFPSWFHNFKIKSGFKQYFDSPCFFVDDQLIAWYLQTHNIKIEQVDRRHRNIYIKDCAIAKTSDNLNKQKGNNSRENTMDKCYTQLNNYYPL